MQTLILADNQDVTRYGMKAIAAGLYPVCVYVEALDWKSLAEFYVGVDGFEPPTLCL